MIEEFLKKKGIKESFERILNPLSFISSPFEYKNLKEAIYFLKEKKENGEKCLIIAHDDMDGISSFIIISTLLKILDIPYEIFIPSKEEDPHGISYKVIDFAIKNNASFIFSVDCGVSSVKEIKYAHEKGLDVIVLDHHKYTHSYDEFFLLHPQNGNGFPFLSASSFSLMLFYGYYLLEGRDFEYLYENYPDEIILSACGAIADRVPIIGDNLFIVNKAKDIIKEKRGMLYQIYYETLGKEPDIYSFVSTFSSLSTKEGKFLLIYLFKDEDFSLKKEYFLRILKEEKLSAKYSKESLNIAKEFIDLREDFVLVIDKNIRLKSLGWIANVLKRKYMLPSIVIGYRSNGVWVGEGRSFPPISIYNLFNKIKDIFIDFGGHDYAAGFSISYENLKYFDKKFEDAIKDEKQRNIKEIVDICIDGKYFEEMEKILKLGKQNFYLSVYIEKADVYNLRKKFGGEIFDLPEEGIYDLVLTVDETGGKIFWKRRQNE